MERKVKLEELPFDQYQRYRDVARLVKLLPDAAKSELVDIGGHPGLINDFVKGPEITITDVQKVEAKNFVRADATSLPFDDDSFLTAVSLDTLEHIHPDKRYQLLLEAVRVSKENIILTAPFHNQATVLAEELVYEFYKKTMKKELPVLKEHLDNGLPDLKDTVSFFKEQGYKVATYPSGYLFSWVPMQMAKIYIQSMPETQKLEKMFDNFYNLYFYDKDHTTPSYRTVIIASKNKKADVDKIAESFIDNKERRRSNEGADMSLVMLSLFDIKHKAEIKNLTKELEDSKLTLRERQTHIKNLEAANKELREWVDKIQKTVPYKMYSSIKRKAKTTK